ncbi:hypothetical protein [Streptomyces cinerochromogenes]|uniref:hypothetical protein n=1 Tax=Streptomyces cinerochromogenes TaxID=66422 RepID=UPI001670C254|nr:hypothetical protein [Streptomyces cinerochromogenes]GGS84329.1 hypothetical protein GCM10010206_53740 [Streptomyces cinerochromogenes]
MIRPSPETTTTVSSVVVIPPPTVIVRPMMKDAMDVMKDDVPTASGPFGWFTGKSQGSRSGFLTFAGKSDP